MWRNGSGGRAAGLIYLHLSSQRSRVRFSGVCHKFRTVWITIPVCLIKQPNGTLISAECMCKHISGLMGGGGVSADIFRKFLFRLSS